MINSLRYQTVDKEVSISPKHEKIPEQFTLYQNYPNPFNPSTSIQYQLPKCSDVKIVIFNLLGQKVYTLVDARMPAGYHNIEWDGRDDTGKVVSSGIYMYRFTATNFTQSRKMLLVR